MANTTVKKNIKQAAKKETTPKEMVKAVVNKEKVIVKKLAPDMKKLEKRRKIITGSVVSTKMQNTVVVSYTRKVAHKKYGKLIKVTKRIKADTNGMEIALGDIVKIQQTKPISRDKYFKVIKKEAGSV